MLKPIRRAGLCRMMLALAACLFAGQWNHARAQDDIRIVPVEPTPEAQSISLPYAFVNQSFGFAVGWVYSVVGYPQKQAAMLASAMVGTNGSALGFFMARDVQTASIERLFTDSIFSIGYYNDADAYINGNPDFPTERAGSNDSDKNNFVEGDGFDTFARVRFKYLLPVGDGRDQIVTDYKLDRGVLVGGASGGSSWNPMDSGRTFLEVRPFYRSQSIDGDDIDTDLRTNGMDFSAFWDNRDFPIHPSTGSSVRARVSRDFGALDSSGPWTVYEGEIDKYFSLGATDDWFRQRVLAFDIWTAESPTWEEQPDGTVNGGPPPYTGATLGGLFRLRGYPTQRFSDKAGLLYSTELHLMPYWNPFPDWKSLQDKVGVQWMEFVLFGELGRVAPHWDLETLHEDMKSDVGVGLRMFAKGMVLRVDFAKSTEGSEIQMMVGSAFQF